MIGSLKVLNIHIRILNQSKSRVSELLGTLSTENDQIWPKEKWPEMKFKEGMQIGAIGGHGPIRYAVEKYDLNSVIQFRFLKPLGFNGIHKFEIRELTKQQTEIKHTIAMETNGMGTLKWVLAIRPLHDALIEDGFDSLENKLTGSHKATGWNIWVRFVRKQMAIN